jgi:hypothetical protein
MAKDSMLPDGPEDAYGNLMEAFAEDRARDY